MIRSSDGPAIGTFSSAPGGAGTDSSCLVHSGLRPAARSFVRVRHVSAPAISTTSARPCWMSRQARLTRVCGTLPPMPV
ncbi:hypothetical protein C6A87_014585 [Mycobacterium sp. ITM-2016-00317]|nr:hypothetical protein [Mycobacterium sp. ITM-2016-00317]WNG90557.1 hypothetical protein C6A87_014585 [Mycobacterium sp. ITM-2016-00317]